MDSHSIARDPLVFAENHTCKLGLRLVLWSLFSLHSFLRAFEESTFGSGPGGFPCRLWRVRRISYHGPCRTKPEGSTAWGAKCPACPQLSFCGTFQGASCLFGEKQAIARRLLRIESLSRASAAWSRAPSGGFQHVLNTRRYGDMFDS